MTTALDIITGAAKNLGVIFKDEALPADEANDGLIALNDMLDSWSNDNLMTAAYTLESFPLTGAANYTIGVGGDFDTARPINISTAVVRIATTDYDLDIISQEAYQLGVTNKSLASQIPSVLTYDNAYPLGTITIYQVPTGGSTLRMLSNKPLLNLSANTSIVDMPPGWKKALKFNLALELAPQYGAQPDSTVVAMARESKAQIKRAASVNSAMPLLVFEDQGSSIFRGY